MGHTDHSCCCDGNSHGCDEKNNKLLTYLPAAISFVLLAAGIIMDNIPAITFFNGALRLVWYIAAYLPVGFPVLKEMVEAMKQGAVFSEFTLMSIATIGAFYIGEYPEGVAVVLFYSVGELFQHSAVERAKKNINALLDIRPESAAVIRNGQAVIVKPEEVAVGETIEMKAGERVSLDGTMESERGSFNTAALTGESVPRTIRRGEEVLAGMISTDSVVRVKVTKPFGDSALARILKLVEEASERKAPAENFIRRFARIYTPAVVGLAALIVLAPWLYSLASSGFIYDFNGWLYRGLVFLVISCPCALVISIPLGYFGGIGAASRHGVLFKGGNYLDAITKVDTVVMDKTGTLTHGVFEVHETIPAEGFTKEELLRTLAAIEQQSNHPIARAIADAFEGETPKATEVKEVAGHGVEGTVEGKKVLAGNAKLMRANGIGFPKEVENIAETTVLCAVDGRYAGGVIVADRIKEDAREAVRELKKLGIKRIVMLSGDKQEIVTKNAGETGITEAYGNLLPEDKTEYLKRFKGEGATVAFVGDGINDAPVLAMSDVGIAMGGLGSDAAIETADVIIQTDQPSKIAAAIEIGRATKRIIIQNISMAFGIKLTVLILGAGGIATLWEAVFADVGVALLAVLNAIRIMKKRF